MATHGVSQLPVVEEGECVGSVSESELMARVIEDPKLLDKTVSAVMEPPYPVVDGHQDLDQATRLLTRTNAACLVREDGRLAGIVTRFDVVSALTQGSGS
jgi:cystathionine beta-synthase